jgi:hypothetical protein
MSAFDRLAGTEEPKLPVWPLITDFTRVMDGELSFAQLAATFELSASEQTEVGEYLTAIGVMVTSRVQSLMADGLGQEIAIETARAIVNAKVMHAMLRAEQGTHDEASFRAVFGL